MAGKAIFITCTHPMHTIELFRFVDRVRSKELSKPCRLHHPNILKVNH